MTINSPVVLFVLLSSISTAVLSANPDRQPTADSRSMSAQTTQMMSRERLKDMSNMMQQMQTMTHDMNRIMENTPSMDQTRIREMSRVMEQLSQAMHSMSQNMQEGAMNQNMMQEMEQHMNKISEMIQQMEQDTP